MTLDKDRAAASGYRVHIRRPSRVIDESTPEESSSSQSPGEQSSHYARRPADTADAAEARSGKQSATPQTEDDAGKSRGHKTKHHKDADEPSPVSTPDPASQTPAEPARNKASEGY